MTSPRMGFFVVTATAPSQGCSRGHRLPPPASQRQKTIIKLTKPPDNFRSTGAPLFLAPGGRAG